MDKSEDAFRTISEAAEELDLPQHVLRFWETRFPQIRPLKRGGGRRYYRPDDVELLRAIRHLLYSDGYTIKGVQRMLKERGAREVLSMRGQSAGTVGDARPMPPERIEHASTPELWDASSAPLRMDDADDFEIAPGASARAAVAAPAPAPQAGAIAGQPMAMQPVGKQPVVTQRLAPAWTSDQHRKLSAIAGELAECRRILSAANN